MNDLGREKDRVFVSSVFSLSFMLFGSMMMMSGSEFGFWSFSAFFLVSCMFALLISQYLDRDCLPLFAKRGISVPVQKVLAVTALSLAFICLKAFGLPWVGFWGGIIGFVLSLSLEGLLAFDFGKNPEKD